MNDPEAACSDFLRSHDRDRYYMSLFVQNAHRASVQSLLAFNADIAAIPARVSEPTPGEIRLQWWHDTLEGVEHGTVGNNPLAHALRNTIERYQLPSGPLLRLIAARRFDLYQDPMPDMNSFEGYAGETVSTIYQYATMIVAEGVEPDNGDAAGHLGVAHALIGHLRAFGYNASKGRIFLPLAIFKANGVEDSEILAGQPTPQIIAAMTQLHEIAADHLQKAQSAIERLPKAQRVVFGHVALLDRQLRAQRRVSDPYQTAPDIANWRKIVDLAWWVMRKA